MWSVRRTSCFTVYTHPEIIRQVIVDHRTCKIVWDEKEFNSVEEAKDYAERKTLSNFGHGSST